MGLLLTTGGIKSSLSDVCSLSVVATGLLFLRVIGDETNNFLAGVVSNNFDLAP